MAVEDVVKFISEIFICPIQYNSVVKSYSITGQDISSPIVFKFSIEEESVVMLDVFLCHGRFSRGTGNNPNDVKSILVGSYDSSGKLEFIKSGCDNQEFLDLNLKLESGNYFVWVYNSYFKLPDPKPDHYIVQFI
jgi:hypothetical protein